MLKTKKLLLCNVGSSQEQLMSFKASLEFHYLVTWHHQSLPSSFHISVVSFSHNCNSTRRQLTVINFQKLENYEQQLRSLKEDNLIDPSVNISMFDKWSEGRQGGGFFFEWLQLILGITTTTQAPPLTPPAECAECSCGRTNSNKIVGGSETGISEFPWMAMLLYSNRFYCGASLISDRYVMGELSGWRLAVVNYLINFF